MKSIILRIFFNITFLQICVDFIGTIFVYLFVVCVCVCDCVREREEKRQKNNFPTPLFVKFSRIFKSTKDVQYIFSFFNF